MNVLEKIRTKIRFDFLAKKLALSFTANEFSSIDKLSGEKLLSICGYEKKKTRDLELFTKGDKETIVLDEALGFYSSDINDVAMRKSPTIKEMLSFKKAKKILNDSDILKSRKEDTINFLRDNFINALEISIDHPEEIKDQIVKKLSVYIDANAEKELFDLILVAADLINLKYLPSLSKTADAIVYADKKINGGEKYFFNIIIFNMGSGSVQFQDEMIKEKDIKKFLKEELDYSDSNIESYLSKIGDALEEKIKGYSPLETDLFTNGIPDTL